jgi:glutamyl-tRNA synthetase
MNIKTEKIIVRYPPSPSGNLHIGNIRSLLFNYLYMKKAKGDAVMRFEDTDRERSKKEFEDTQLETLSDLGIEYNKGPFKQSDRTEFYSDAIEKLINNNNAFEGEESQDGSGDKVIRFKNPNKKVTFTDTIRGEVTIDTTDFGDFVIARSKTNPLYHLTVVVDDIDMGITDVIRGEDHITSTPRQILLIEALGGMIPRYAHLPLIVGDDKKKLGKRHGATTWQEFKKQGYLSEGVVNYLALLG